MSEAVVVVPHLYPVLPEEVALLEQKLSVPQPLKDYWLNHGYGFFTHGLDGEFISDSVANRLIFPEEVLDLLENAADLAHELVHGLPFFEMNDRRYLLLDEQGKSFARRSICRWSPRPSRNSCTA